MPLNQDTRAPNRNPPTFLQAINPYWWLCDVERNPEWTWWAWFKRNPAHNFKSVIIGVCHKERICHYKGSGWTLPEYGWNYGYTTVNGYPPLPFIAHRGDKYEYAFGWMTSGAFATTFRNEHSPNATQTDTSVSIFTSALNYIKSLFKKR
jgi:hypothetical protein